MKITPAQIKAVTGLSGPKRYDHFIKVAADRREVWGLYNGGWALAATQEEKPVFPVWPAPEYAAMCASNAWADYKPRAIDLDDFLEGLLPSLRERGTQLGVFYTVTHKGVLPTLEQVERDLRAELLKIE